MRPPEKVEDLASAQLVHDACVRSDRARNMRWVLEQIDELPLATGEHLGVVSALLRGPAEKPTIYALCRELRQARGDEPPFLHAVTEPGGSIGYILTRAGVSALDPTRRTKPPRGVDGATWWSEPVVSATERTLPHIRLTTDLAVVLMGVGRTSTEFSARRKNPGQLFRVDWEADTSRARRPDLFVDVDGNRWVVEIERSEKGNDEDGKAKYTELVMKHMAGMYAYGGLLLGVMGAWYLTNDRQDLRLSRRSLVGDRLVRGVYAAAEKAARDVLYVVQPAPLDEIAGLRVSERLTRLRHLLAEVQPLLSWRPAPPPTLQDTMVRGYVLPSAAEKTPRSITELTVVAVGKLAGFDPLRRRGSLKVGDRYLTLHDVPDGLAVEVNAGDRVIAVGQLDGAMVLTPTSIRRIGIDWQPPPQVRGGQTRRALNKARRQSDDLHRDERDTI